ncbi:hypothetical protein [Photobacterium sp. GB-1]|uniref:hypothetical protein n=1 Tax=Photobacterium sp. GB-1 TaxID=2022111 RepID=UPI000D176554|nr:hypothetical protein [Photobacterium sp. GB-1]PSV52022.1 hypothetical protein C9J45_12695 [Photobacterium sp. GB-1]
MRCSKIFFLALALIPPHSMSGDIAEEYRKTCSPIEHVKNVEIGSWSYEGGFCKGMPHGNGTQSNNRTSLNGLYIEGTLVGRVLERRVDGALLIGPYVEGRRNGGFKLYIENELVTLHFYKRGILKSSREPMNMAKYYVGEYDDIGQRSGQGSFTHPDSGIRYSGDWLDDALNGNGEIIFPDGSTYKGGFIDNRRNGFGEEVIIGKYRYSGLWHKGRMHGLGEIKYESGCHYTGDFVNGRRLGDLICPK